MATRGTGGDLVSLELAIIRIDLDACTHGGASCSIYQELNAFEAVQFRETRSEALAAAVAQWRRHSRWMRTQRNGDTLKYSADPIMQMARQVQTDIADARAAADRALSMSRVAARFYTDEPDNDNATVSATNVDANGMAVAA